MKKLLTVLLALFMVFTLVGCNSSEDTPVAQEQEQQEIVEQKEEEPIAGGYVEVEDKTLTDELKDIFNSALKGLMGATYEPVELIATQVVAGTYYKFLANGTKTTNPITKGTYYITIYKDLEGNVELLDIETIEEKQEEVKTNNVDITSMYFWIVTFDQYGNEVDRYTAKYGTSIIDPSTGKTVTVKGNTRFYVTKDYSKPISKEGESTPPTPVNDNALHKGDIIVFNSENTGYKQYLVLKIDGNEATLLNLDYDVKTKFASSNTDGYENSLLDLACNTTFYNNLTTTLQNAIVEKAIDLNQYTYDISKFDEDTHPVYTDLSSKVILGTINRKVYPLDIEDIENYLGPTYSINDVLETTGEKCWLRSVTTDKAWFVDDDEDYIWTSNRAESGVPPFTMPVEKCIRPSFVIDLTKTPDYEKKIKVSLRFFSGNLATSSLANKGDRVVDLIFDDGGNSLYFEEKTYGTNTFYLITGGAGDYVPVFNPEVNSYDQLVSLFNHDFLINFEKALASNIREYICELDYDGYDSSASSWDNVDWDQVSSDFDVYMVSDVIFSFFYIDTYYSSNSAAYDLIIGFLKPYFVSSNLIANNTMNIYYTTG